MGWFGSLLNGKTDASGLQYPRNRYYDPGSGRFTQKDPIGLAGGINQYGYASGDPVNGSDPFGLEVCFSGTKQEIQEMKTATQDATGTTFIVDDKGCVVKGSVSAISRSGWDEMALGFKTMADYEGLTLMIAYDPNKMSEYGPGGISINRLQATTGRYETNRTRSGVCSTTVGAVFTLESAIAHELGHAFKNFHPLGSDVSVQWENVVHWRQARPFRHPGCAH